MLPITRNQICKRQFLFPFSLKLQKRYDQEINGLDCPIKWSQIHHHTEVKTNDSDCPPSPLPLLCGFIQISPCTNNLFKSTLMRPILEY